MVRKSIKWTGYHIGLLKLLLKPGTATSKKQINIFTKTSLAGLHAFHSDVYIESSNGQNALAFWILSHKIISHDNESWISHTLRGYRKPLYFFIIRQ